MLVTGSSGLIGSTLCPILTDRGFEVFKMDICPDQKTKQMPEFGDILEVNELADALRNIDGVIHLAAVSRVIDAEKSPQLCQLTNVNALQNLLFLAKKQSSPPWIVFASSREIYGEPFFLPVPEDHPLNPINVYGKSKKTAEQLLLDVAVKGITSIIFRFSNVYGSPFDHPTRVIPAFLTGALTKTAIRVDSPNHIFDFTHVTDITGAILVAIEALTTNKFEKSKIFNLSFGKGTSLAHLVELVKEIAGTDILIVKGEQRKYDVSQYVGDNRKIQNELGYCCRIPLKEGLKLLYEEYANNWGSLTENS